MRKTWACALLCVVVLSAGARAQEFQWRPAASRATAVTAQYEPTSAPAVSSAPQRAASLGLPITASGAPASSPAPLDSSIAQTAFSNVPPAEPPPPSAVRAQGDPFAPSLQPPPGYTGAPALPPPVSSPAPLGGYPMQSEELYNRGVVTEPPGGPRRGGGAFSGVGDVSSWFGSFSSPSRGILQSDHCFDNFISPITNPFLFEDPRALTELRPIFMQQGAPNSNWVFHGGDAQFFGVQARVAITERVSFVINKFGGVWTEPSNPPPGFGDGSSFAEFWLGPKYTFFRNESSGTVGAVGWTFQIPAGSSGGNTGPQNVGDLSNTPYISMAQNFWRTSYGSMNAMGTFGYTFGSSNARSDYIFLSTHLDYDILQAHTWYPVLEMNFFDYTQAGNGPTLGFEGRDLVNYGSQAVSGRKYLTMAPGFRWVFWKGQNNANAQTGFAVELPIVGTRDILAYRINWDMIFRY